MTNKRTLKFAAILCALTMLSGISAYAAKYDFYLTVYPGGNSVSTSANPKSDNEQKAYVTVLTKSGTGIIQAYAANPFGVSYTTTMSITKTGSYTANYTTYTPAGAEMRLHMRATTQSSPETMTGRWNS